jgi:mRNA interferase MazF
MVKKYIPERVDVVWVNFYPCSGHEKKGKRPAFVVSSKYYNQKSGLTLVCPITSQIKNYPFEVMLKGMNISGVILVDQIKNLDWNARKFAFVCKTSQALEKSVIDKLLLLISY